MSLPANSLNSNLTHNVPWLLKPLITTLRRGKQGQLVVYLPGQQEIMINCPSPGPSARIELRNPYRFLRRLITRGDLGFAEAFMAGDWITTDLSATLLWFALNEKYLSALGAVGPITKAGFWLKHRININSLVGSRRNIARHYDLGNDFFSLWLDESMTYSAALFNHDQQNLNSAQLEKYRVLYDALDVSPGQHILEIGCGWGGFAEYAAQRGARVTGITLSEQQLRYARKRIAAAGFSNLVELRLQDYRKVTEQYDHVVSIEMLEAVGERYWPLFFKNLNARLKPGGRAALQTISINAGSFAHYRNQVDFIQLYIFPGGMLPTIQHVRDHATNGGLILKNTNLCGPHYATTLRHWHHRLLEQRQQFFKLGYDQEFFNMWRYYLAYCEAGFNHGHIDLLQCLLHKPNIN